MKKLISILLVAVMLVAMVPAMAFTTSAATGDWIDEDWDLTWYTEVEFTDANLSNKNNAVTMHVTDEAEANGEEKITVYPRATGVKFYIDTPQELSGLAKVCAAVDASYFGGSTFVINNDIDLSGYNWLPIAHTKGAFCGSIEGVLQTDGKYSEIKNMSMSTTGGWTGFVGCHKTGTIKNLEMTNAVINTTSVDYVGTFVGWQAANANSYINLKSDAKITVTTKATNTGGIVGCVGAALTSIKDCTFTGSINVPNATGVGGIVGVASGTIGEVDNCDVSSTATITVGTKTTNFGGIIGKSATITNGIKNCDFSGTMNTTGYAEHVGGIIGWQSGAISEYNKCTYSGTMNLNDLYEAAGIVGVVTAQTDIVDCHASGTITQTGSERRNRSMVGGIVGGNGYDDNISTAKRIQNIDGCTFTGILDAPCVDRMGGIVGWLDNIDIGRTAKDTVDASKKEVVTIKNCAVVPVEMTWGTDNHYQNDTGAEWRCGFGGIVGVSELGNTYNYDLNGDKTVDDTTEKGIAANSSLKIQGCYVSGDVNPETGKTQYNKTNGGFVGNNCGPVDFVDCQYDAVAWDSANKMAAFIGRVGGKMSFTNCVNTGIAFNAGSAGGFSKNAMLWVAQGNVSATMTNCYTSANELLYYGAADTYRPTQITATTEFTGLDLTSTWTKREGSMYPVLTIAKDLAPADSITRGGVDMSWLNTNLLSMQVTTEAQLKGVDRTYDAFLARDTANLGKTISTYQTMLLDRVTLAPTLAKADLSGYSEAVQNFVKSELGVSDNVDTAQALVNMDKSVKQLAINPNADGTYNVRFSLLVKDSDHKGVTVEVGGSRTKDGAVQYGAFLESETITTCYKAIIEDGNTRTAAEEAGEGWYYVSFVLENVDTSIETTFTVRANVTLANGTVTQSVAQNFTVGTTN